MRRLRAIRRGGVPPSSLDLIESPTGGGTPPVLRKKTPAFWRVFALLASEKPEGWLGYGFLRREGSANRANRFKLDSLAFAARLGGVSVDRLLRGRRLGDVFLCSWASARHPGCVFLHSLPVERRLGGVFLCSEMGTRRPGRVFLPSHPVERRPGNDFLHSCSLRFYPCDDLQALPLSQRPLRTKSTKTNTTHGR